MTPTQAALLEAQSIRAIVAKMRADLTAVGGFDNELLGVPAGGVRAHIEALEAALSAAEAAQPEPQFFDAEGFHAFVLRELPDQTIVGSSKWWADHLSKWAAKFCKRAQPAPIAAQAGPAQAPLTDAIASAAYNTGIRLSHDDIERLWSAMTTAAAQAPASTRPADASISGQRVDMKTLNALAAQTLRRIADEPPINGNNMARARVLIASDELLVGALAAAPQAPAEPAAQAVEQDAARYRWLRDKAPGEIVFDRDNDDSHFMLIVPFDGEPVHNDTHSGMKLDEAIDAAMAATPAAREAGKEST